MPTTLRSALPAALLLGLSTVAAAAAATGADAACHARSTGVRTTVVELYTSEGCNSCPPADTWLSSLRGREGVLALAFHVDYWDRLGWTDRFASPVFTARQQQVRASSGARFVYTPQVLLDGADWRRWPGAPPRAGSPSPVRIALQREGGRAVATVTALATIPAGEARWTGYWAVVEDGWTSRVRAGENAGVTLRHDHVVRHYRPLSAWSATGTTVHTLDLPPSEHRARRVAFVVTDATSGRPVDALALDC
jgi:hypothetical protein